MQFQDVNQLIATSAKRTLIQHLFLHEAEMSEREIARLTKLSHMTVNRLLKEFELFHLVSWRRVGNANIWKVNRSSYAFTALQPLVVHLGKKTDPFDDLKVTLLEIIPKTGVRRIILYGSVSKGKARRNSDIDLFVEVDSVDQKNKIETLLEKNVSKILDRYGNLLSPYIETSSKFRNLKNQALVKNIEDGVVLYQRGHFGSKRT